MIGLTLDSIPAELRERPQWVTWKYNAERSKLPCSVQTGKVVDATDPANWATFDAAYTAYRHRHHAGIGFVFTPDDPFVGIDLDDCLADGQLTPDAATIVAAMGTYTEVSPSGKGVKMWVRGSVPGTVKTAQIEIYDHARYFTVTGARVDGTPPTIRDGQAELGALYATLRPADPARPAPVRPLPSAAPDAERARRWCLAALEGERQKMLAAGEGERHNRRYASAFALAGLMHTGGITEAEIFTALAVNFGRDQRNAEQTIRDGICKGMEYPRSVRDLEADDDPSRPADPVPVASPDGATVTLTREEYERLRRKAEGFDKLDAWRQWVVTLAALPAAVVSPGAVKAALVLRPELQSRVEHGQTDPAPLWIEDAAGRAGESPGTFGKHVKELAEVGALQRETKRDPVTGFTRVLVAPRPAFFDPATWARTTPRNHGGVRPGAGRKPACSKCPPGTLARKKIKRTATFTCLGCGDEFAVEELPDLIKDYEPALTPGNQVECWRPAAVADPDNQDEGLKKDRCPSLAIQDDCRPPAAVADSDNQLEFRPPTPPGARFNPWTPPPDDLYYEFNRFDVARLEALGEHERAAAIRVEAPR